MSAEEEEEEEQGTGSLDESCHFERTDFNTGQLEEMG